LKIVPVDCHYLRPQFAAAYLVHDGRQALFVETNTTRAVPRLLEALQAEGLRPEQVAHVIITHVHLDHAGGCHALMAACPEVTLLAHPRAARHVVDPSRLVTGARQVYGDEAFERLYGHVSPVDARRVRAVADGESLAFGGATLQFWHTRGHANHHMCIAVPEADVLFTGDAFGLAYPELQRAGLFVFPSTSPTDFDAEAALETVDRIAASGLGSALLTHFGAVTDLVSAAAQLRGDLTFAADLVTRAIRSDLPDAALPAWCRQHLGSWFAARAARQGLQPTAAEWEWLALDLDLNAAGVAHRAVRLRNK